MNDSGRGMSARTGIFWVYENEVLAVTAPVESGTDSGGMIDSSAAHVDEWPRIQAPVPRAEHV